MTYPSARDGVESSKLRPDTPQTRSPAYELAYADEEFLCRSALRPVRLQLELMKPDLLLKERRVYATFVIFGSARTLDRATSEANLRDAKSAAQGDPDNEELQQAVKKAEREVKNSHYYEEARKLAALVSSSRKHSGRSHFTVATGGGPGIMEAANRGAAEADADSVGYNIVLPFEQAPNTYVTPELCFNFHYFAIRKMHFLMRAEAVCAFPGGFGTLDELFETLTLIQTRKVKRLPILLFGQEFWSRVVNFDTLIEEGVISPKDVDLFEFVETAEDAWKAVADFYNVPR
ncbi:MAG: TIGR00730 family Rossman fold protein [Planctomycetota bacterium]